MNHQSFDTSQFPTGLGMLIPPDEICPVGAGEHTPDIYPELKDLDLDKVFAPRTIVDRDMARACASGLWLIHGYLDESHEISQDLKTPTGSFWHGIMHRREGDFSNAKYWFRSAGDHPVLDELAADAAEIIGEPPAERATLLDAEGRFDPMTFVDWCQASARGDHSQDADLERLTRREWERLFAWCYRQAVGER